MLSNLICENLRNLRSRKTLSIQSLFVKIENDTSIIIFAQFPGGFPISFWLRIHKYLLDVQSLSCCQTHIPFTNPSKKSRSCETTISVPSKSINACFSISLVFISKWLVGSSRISKLTGSSNNLSKAKSGAFASKVLLLFSTIPRHQT